MPSNATNTVQPVLDEATRSFVRRSLSAGLLELDDLKKVVVSLMAESESFTPERLANGLIGAGILSNWQASKLLAGKSRGFFLGSYRLLRPLGRGGMGVVYLGEHHVMKRLMALKILPPEASKDDRRIDRFKSEARACAQLDHPNIVRAYDFSSAGGKLYIVMEFVDGIDLHYAVQRDGPMSPANAIDILQQAASGLSHAHERGIVHRDIKPSNLLLRTDGVVKVSDLGLARIGWGDEEEKRLMGTADFLAPEQAINSNVADTRSDIYSLGCTLYYLLTGKVPYEGTSAQRLAKHQTAPVPDVRKLRPECPVSVASLTARMMAKKPADRPKSASELLSQLKRLTGTVGTVQRGLEGIAPAGDTVVDGSLYQATIDDTSLSSGGEVNVAQGADDFDFANLPASPSSSGGGFVDLSSIPAATAPTHAGVPGQRPAAAVKPAGAGVGPTHPATQPNPVGGGTSANQQVLLGVGLAIAFLALIGVVGLGIYNAFKPIPKEQPNLKISEGSKNKKIQINGNEVRIIQDSE